MEDKRLDRLFEYTKFHIGIYLSVAGGFVSLIGLSATAEKGAFLDQLVGSPALLLVSFVSMLLAGVAGGILASATTKYERYDELWLKPQGPFSAYTNICGRTWATIEHGAFWLSVVIFSCSIISADPVLKWLQSRQEGNSGAAVSRKDGEILQDRLDAIKPEVSVIQQISKQMDSLTLAVNNLKPSTLPIDSPHHYNRADKGGAGQITEQMTGKVTIGVPVWVENTLIVIFFGSVILFVFGGVLVIKNRSFQNIGTPSIVISILSGLLSGSSFLAIKDNKIELDTLFTCKECGVDVSLGAPAKTIQLFGESPSFDIGTAEIDQKTVCIDTQKNIKKEWDDWLAELSKAWKERSGSSNTLLIVGSSDRQPLRGTLAQQFGSNEGLARARAETVKKKLIEEINGNKENKGNVLDGRNIIILTAGPEKTPAVASYVKQGEQSCNDLAGDRKVRLWINAATSK